MGKKTYQTVPQEHMRDVKRRLSLNNDELAKKLGVSPASVANWIREDQGPKWTQLACQALLMDKREAIGNGALPARNDGILVIRCEIRYFDAFKVLAEGIEAQVLELK